MNGDTPHGSRHVCGATTRSGAPCRRAPVPGRQRCKLHGGASPRGVASASWRHGRYSQAVPQRLRERFDASITDPDLLSHRRDLALLDLRLDELLGRIDSGKSVEGARLAVPLPASATNIHVSANYGHARCEPSSKAREREGQGSSPCGMD